MYPKFTCSCRVELSIGNEHVFYRRRVYFSADAHQLKGNPKKNPPVNFKGTAIFAITIYMPCVLYTAGSRVC